MGCDGEVDQLAVIEDFKLHREELEERIESLEDEIAHREEVNQAQLEQQDREQVEGKNKYETTPYLFQFILTRASPTSRTHTARRRHLVVKPVPFLTAV